MLKLKTEEEVLLESDEEINAHLLSYFQNLFTAVAERDFSEALLVIQREVSTEMNMELIKPVSDDEIRLAAFQLGPLKAPGPDGFQGIFYQKHWAIVGPEVCLAIKIFFSHGSLNTEWNHTNLVLIPKIVAPEKLNHYRPISLCNFKMKIITKILANRLKRCLHKLIFPNQAAFVPGRQIQDSILVAHECFHFLKQKKRDGQANLALKLDFNKAYDRIQWDFLQAVLDWMGFHEIWIK